MFERNSRHGKAVHKARYSSKGKEVIFYVRCLIEKIPEGKNLNFRGDRNYPVLGIDSQNNKLLTHDDEHKLLWLPTSLFRFVKVS